MVIMYILFKHTLIIKSMSRLNPTRVTESNVVSSYTLNPH